MDLINRYFNDLVFYKVDQRENYTIYAANISSAAMVDSKLSYILVFVPNYLATILTDSPKAIILDIRVPSLPVAELVGHQASVNGIAWAPHSPCHICTIRYMIP